MTTLHTHQRVANYDIWKRGFDQVLSSSLAVGLHSFRIWRGEDDASLVVVEYTFESREAAESFVYNPAVLDEMTHAGVDETSVHLEFLDEVGFADL